MTSEAILHLMTQPDMLRQVSIEDLHRTVEAYPCFAMARMLYVKVLKDKGDLDYSRELFKASLQAPSRRQFFYYVQGRKQLQDTSEPSYVETYLQQMPETVGEKMVSDDFSLIDRFLSEQSGQNDLQQGDASLSEMPVYDVEKALGDGSDVEEDDDVIRCFLEANPPMDDSSSGRIFDSCKPERSLPEQPEQPLREQPKQPEVSPDVDAPVMPEAAFTLTLARIYLKQKKYDRALEIFRSLVLKNPEKSIYFADQIRYLEKVINNLKK